MNLRKKYMEGIGEMERWYLFDGENERILKIMPLVRNGKFLLLGPYGFGKSFYAGMVARVFFGYSRENIPMVQLTGELSINDVFFHIDVPSLMNGEERIEPRDIVTEPFKFINEFQRGNHKVYNTFLGLFEEGFVSYRDKKFRTKDYIAIMDANPFDSGSVEIPSALMDRITASVNMRSLPGTDMLDLMDKRIEIDKVKRVMKYEEMKKLWDMVESVEVSGSMNLLMAILHSYFSSCIHGDKAVVDHRYLSSICDGCRYKMEPCYMLREPLGHRWWKDVRSIAKANAFFEGRGQVIPDDIFFAAKYALQHRVRTRERLRTLYKSKEHWMDDMLSNAKLKLWKIWIPALKGDRNAMKMDERTLSFLGDAL